MSLKEELLGLLPDHVYHLVVDRADVHGLKAIRVTVFYRDPADRLWFLDINFADKNKMTVEEMAASINSRLKFKDEESSKISWDHA